MNYSNYLYSDIPRSEIIKKAVEVLESNPSLDESGLLYPHCLFILARILIRLDLYHDAEVALKKSQDIYSGLGNGDGIARINLLLGYISRLLGKKENAEMLYRQAREHYLSTGNRIVMSDSLQSIALVTFERKDTQLAIKQLEQAREEAGDHEPTRMAADFKIAWVSRKDNPTYAIELLRKVRKSYQEYGARNMASLCQYQMGVAYSMKRDFDGAIRTLLVAYEEFQLLDNYGQMAFTLDWLADSEEQRGNLEAALRYNGESLSIVEKIENHKQVVLCFVSRGRFLVKMGQVKEALVAFESAAKTARDRCDDVELEETVREEIEKLSDVEPVSR
ncbi:hypothetical protein AMATHDRAFT_51831 [Amanita thiersii Skay4041]|uniref:Tetratricopeptide repeat protein 29 n=1 Tax=Amanita thiersii Skay4041 TaxID=703135 RepID=A0A2A9NBK0_9AGAR|nr:hypothetical protein AMATHDRAFT_51831 [Amanita thiersii Skay4041]